MNPDIESPSDDQILSALVEAQLVSPTAAVQLQRYPPNFTRKDERQKMAFRVWVGDGIGFHLTVGAALDQLHRRTEAFAQAHPEIACKPLFFVRAHDLDFFGQEYFGQDNLEDGLRQKRIDEQGWQAGVMTIKAQLRARSQPSSLPSVLEEINALEQRLLSLEWFSLLDQTLLRSEVFPVIRQRATEATRRATWTNGDFVARNILFDGQGRFRLIDCEFAAPTHFEEIDWFRLQHFSTIPPSVNLVELSGYPTWPKWLEVLGWLQHALRLSEICIPNAITQDLQLIADHLAPLLQSDSLLARRSVLFNAFGREPASISAPGAALPTAQLFWSKYTGYSEEQSVRQPLRSLDAWTELSFDLPALPAASVLRFDPSDCPGLIEISRIVIEQPTAEATPNGPDEIASLLESGAGLVAEGDCVALANSTPLRFLIFGNDPILKLPPIPAAAAGRAARLKVSLRLTLHIPTKAWEEAMHDQQLSFFRVAGQGQEVRLKMEAEIASLRQRLGEEREKFRQATEAAQGLEAALAALRRERDEFVESLHAQNAALLDFEHRSVEAAGEFKRLEERLDGATQLTQDLRARLTKSEQQFADETLLRRGKEAELARLRQRLLVRLDAVFRRDKPGR